MCNVSNEQTKRDGIELPNQEIRRIPNGKDSCERRDISEIDIIKQTLSSRHYQTNIIEKMKDKLNDYIRITRKKLETELRKKETLLKESESEKFQDHFLTWRGTQKPELENKETDENP